MILVAGLEGVREKLDPGVPHTENMYKYTLAELKEKEIKMLPRTLGEAVDAFEGSREGGGASFFDFYFYFSSFFVLVKHIEEIEWGREEGKDGLCLHWSGMNE